MTLGKMIAARRKVLRFTQEELAAIIGVSKSAIAKWETDGGIPDRDNLKRLSDVMEIPLDYLYRVINKSETEVADMTVNITHDVITALESYGYKVIRPGADDKNCKED